MSRSVERLWNASRSRARFRNPDQTGHRESVSCEHTQAVTHARAGMFSVSHPCMLAQNVSRGEQLASEKCAETTPGCKQAVDQSHVRKKLSFAGVWIWVCQPDRDVAAAVELGALAGGR